MQSRTQSTWLSSLHPYPAMIADELAVRLTERFALPEHRVLDPFCGTGRTLMAAASVGAYGVGIDVNPLACLLFGAKTSEFRPTVLESLLQKLPRTSLHAKHTFDLEPGRSVSWFPAKTRRELCGLLSWINSNKIEKRELYSIASVLSATVREVSYCRKSQWKLHRMSSKQRSKYYKPAIQVFERRLRKVLKEAKNRPANAPLCRSISGDSRELADVLRRSGEEKKFDLVISSPPYGDSRTTVQYGGMSSICLGVLQHLRRPKFEFRTSTSIDGSCLGGKLDEDRDAAIELKRYWNGGNGNRARPRVLAFLADLQLTLQQCVKVLKRSGRIILVLSRRCVGGWRLSLDLFVRDVLRRHGFIVSHKFMRQLKNKMLPHIVNRLARSTKKRGRKHVSTMRDETVLVFRRSSRAQYEC